MRWSTHDGHYWLECHMDKALRIPDHKWLPGLMEYKLRTEKNLDAILSFASCSSKGKNLLLRDINRMMAANEEDD